MVCGSKRLTFIKEQEASGILSNLELKPSILSNLTGTNLLF